MQWNRNYFGTIALPLLNRPSFGPLGAKISFLASPFWHYVFSGFKEIRSIFKTPVFVLQNPGTSPETQNEDGRGRRNKFCLSRFLGRGCDEALFSEKKGFSVKRGEAIQ